MITTHQLRTALCFCGLMAMQACPALADITWNYTDGPGNWSSVQMTNQDAGAVGSFSSYTRLVLPDDNPHDYYWDDGTDGLSLEGSNYMKYSFGGSLSGLVNCELTIQMSETLSKEWYDAYADWGADYLGEISPNKPAQYIFLEGTVNGQRVLLAQAFSIQFDTMSPTGYTFDLSKDAFSIVTAFYNTVEQAQDLNFGDLYDVYSGQVTLGGSLSEADFASFMASDVSMIIRAYATDISGDLFIATGPIAYTSIQGFTVTGDIIPEPSAALLRLSGLAFLTLRRRRK